MKTQKIKVYIYAPSDGTPTPRVSTADMQDYGWPLIATREIELELPEVENYAAIELAALQRELNVTEASNRVKVQQIRSRMAEVQKKLSEGRTDGNV